MYRSFCAEVAVGEFEEQAGMSSGSYGHLVGKRLARLVAFIAVTALVCGLLAVSAQAVEPTIESVSATSITSKRARLEATINPGGLETTYEFWATYAVCQGPPGAVECASIADERWGKGQIAAGPSGQVVTATPKRLSPEYLYKYWVVASNSAGEEQSAHQKLTALPAPVVTSESASGVTSSDGRLEAQINPEGQSVYYQFQLAANASEFPSELECPPRSFSMGCLLPTEQEGVLPVQYRPAGSTDQSVSLDLAKAGVTLKPGTTYHYRVLVAPHVQTEDTVEWEGPPVDGADQTFTTQLGPAPPSIESVSLSSLTPTDATLEAQIDTEGLETTYEFKMWASPCSSHGVGCEDLIHIPLPSGKLLGSFVAQSVSLDLSSAGLTLVPGGEYGYSLRASSAAGSVEGKWQTFDAPEELVLPLKSTNPAGVATTSTAGSDVGSQAPDPSLTPSTVGHVVPDLVPGKAGVKGHAKIKRSVKHKKPKRHKSKTAKHNRHKTGKR
jgi:hypothetical protein